MLLIITIPTLLLPLVRSTSSVEPCKIGQEEPLYAPSNEKVCFKADKRHMGHDPQYDVPFIPYPTVTFFVGLYQRIRLDLFGVFFLNTILASIVYKCFGKKRSEKKKKKKIKTKRI